MPFWSSSLPRFNSVQPVEITTNPPPTWTTGIEIPKKVRMSVPMKYDPTSRKKLFIAIRNDSARRVFPGHGQKDRAPTQRVHDWNESTENQEETLRRFNQDVSPIRAREPGARPHPPRR